MARKRRSGRGLGAVARTRSRSGEQARLLGQDIRAALRHAPGNCLLAYDDILRVQRRAERLRCDGMAEGRWTARQAAAVDKALRRAFLAFERGCVVKR